MGLAAAGMNKKSTIPVDKEYAMKIVPFVILMASANGVFAQWAVSDADLLRELKKIKRGQRIPAQERRQRHRLEAGQRAVTGVQPQRGARAERSSPREADADRHPRKPGGRAGAAGARRLRQPLHGGVAGLAEVRRNRCSL